MRKIEEMNASLSAVQEPIMMWIIRILLAYAHIKEATSISPEKQSKNINYNVGKGEKWQEF